MVVGGAARQSSLPHHNSAALARPVCLMVMRRQFGLGFLGFFAAPSLALADRYFAVPELWAKKLIAAAESQIGKTVLYDPGYTSIAYPGGDIPIERGVCTDVVIRAYRTGLGIDLQERVHEDMRRNFAAYPPRWGLKRPDSNIDHRRVPNLEVFFERHKSSLAVSKIGADYFPGDVVSMKLPGNLPHIAIVTHHASEDRSRPLCIHNIGVGTRLEDVLFAFELTGHYRFRV